jgi:hypothetical protein
MPDVPFRQRALFWVLWGAISVILFLAGALLGMCEAYVTKVLWKPTWGDANLWRPRS